MAQDDEVQVGDVVKLKSGGPKMTVTETGEFQLIANGARCQWFDGNHPQEKVFARQALRKADDNEGGLQSVPLRRG